MNALRAVLGEARAEEMIDQLFSFSETIRKLGLFKELQPWTEFFSHFKAPREWTKDELEKRVVTNALHYRTNYMCAFLLVFRYLTASMMRTTFPCIWDPYDMGAQNCGACDHRRFSPHVAFPPLRTHSFWQLHGIRDGDLPEAYRNSGPCLQHI